MQRIAHYYHVYPVNDWQRIVGEHLNAILSSGLDKQIGELRLGCLGTPQERQDVFNFCNDRIATRVVAEAEIGWEQVTLEALAVAKDYDIVLYAHTKGVSNGQCNIWRNNMASALITNWSNCIDLLVDYEAVGCYWQTQDLDPNRFIPVFGGNYWWARSDLIRRLPPLAYESRYDAEGWIGLGDPDIYDALPGLPPRN